MELDWYIMPGPVLVIHQRVRVGIRLAKPLWQDITIPSVGLVWCSPTGPKVVSHAWARGSMRLAKPLWLVSPMPTMGLTWYSVTRPAVVSHARAMAGKSLQYHQWASSGVFKYILYHFHLSTIFFLPLCHTFFIT